MAQWLSPTGYVDPNNQWVDETNAYDENTGTRSREYIAQKSWSSFLELTHAAMSCTKVRFLAVMDAAIIAVDIDAYYNSAWNHVYEGSFSGYSNWVERSLSSTQIITAFRFRFYNDNYDPFEPGHETAVSLYEVDFYEYNPTVAPTVTSQAVSSILSTTATGNGNITATGIGDDGAIVTKRGICYNLTGNPTVADSKVEETGSFGVGAFTEALINLSPGTTYHVKAYAYNSAGYGYGAEADFTTLKVAPTVTVQAPTDLAETTVTANGNITASGGENATVRGFKYGLTQTDTWDAHTDGSFPIGAFTKGLTGLNANTTYWIRAYATNSIGTSYSGWIQFQTAASGTIPTGTKLSICSDYSGYTYKLNAGETDDGETYESYFVLSTDLANGQALNIFKRLLDLDLYFESEDTGTVEIYVKCDNEADWEYFGSVDLTGTADIIVPHLPVDARAKHFLFKISASNYFNFIGCIFEFIQLGER